MQPKETYSNEQNNQGISSIIYNMDCVLGMKHYPDKYFDLAIVDPPFGLKQAKYERYNYEGKRHKQNRFTKKDWDNAVPTLEYFTELFRVSKNQIIWGGNYFDLPPTRCFIFWYKQNPVPNYSDGEYAWASFKRPACCFDYRYYGNVQGNTGADIKIHPTQKPVQLYTWMLNKFAVAGDKILDTHLGSGGSRIACYNAGFDFTSFEIDKEYCELQEARFKQAIMQQRLF